MEHEARQDPRAVTATAGGSQGEPGAAPAPDRPPRRRRRWWRWILLSLAVLAAGGAGGGYILRTQVLAEVIARTLPEVLALKLGTPVALGGIGVLEGSAADAGLSITFSSLDVGAGDPQAPLHLRLEGGRVRFHGWWALLRGIDGIAGVDIARAVVHHRVEPGASSEDGKIPDPVLPAALPEIPFPVVIGRLELSSGSRSLAGALEAAAGRVLLEAREIEGVAGLESARVEAFLAAGGIPRLAARVEPGAMKLEGRLHPAEGGWQGALDLETPLVRGALELALPGAPGGTATLDATIEDLEGLASDLGIEGAQASRSPIAELHLSLGGGRYRITGACSTAEGTLRIAGGGDARELSLRVLTDDFNVGELLRRIRGVPAELEPRALTSGEIRLRGPYSDLRGDAELRLHDGTVRLAGEQLPLGNTVLLASLHDGRLAIDEIRTDAFGGDLEATGGIPLEEGQEWQMAFTYHDLEVARLRPWAPALRALSGRVEGRGEIIGARDAPRLFTEGWLKGGELAPGSWERLTEIEGRFELRPERLEVTGISARLGGGTVTGSGELLLGAPVERGDGIAEGETFRTTLHLDRVRLFRSTDMLARGSGDLTLRGTPAEPQLSGSVEIVRGIYHRNVYPSLEGGDGLPFDLFSVEEGFGARLTFDVQLLLGGGFRVRNNRLTVAPHGELHLGGTGRQPVLTGVITATEGAVKLPHLELTITRTEVEFPQEDPFHPHLQFQGQGICSGVEVQAVAYGSLMSPEVVFSSTPYLPEEELLALIATGYLPDKLLEQGIESVAALEVLRIYGPQVWEHIFGRSHDSGLKERFEFTKERADDPDEEDRLVVEVKLKDWLSLAAERDHRGDVNLDVLFFLWMP